MFYRTSKTFSFDQNRPILVSTHQQISLGFTKFKFNLGGLTQTTQIIQSRRNYIITFPKRDIRHYHNKLLQGGHLLSSTCIVSGNPQKTCQDSEFGPNIGIA